MIHEKIFIDTGNNIKEAEFKPYIRTYILDNYKEIDRDRIRPTIVICPGGGYTYCSEREAEAVALRMNSLGYHAIVLYYSVRPSVYPTSLMELAKTVCVIRKNADIWNIDKNRIIIAGFSAGAHLAASLGVLWSKEKLAGEIGEAIDNIKPNGLMLAYPVITSGQFAHADSFRNLLGNDYEKMKEELSLELLVNNDTPKTFLWHTFSDAAVPVENSLLFAQALRKNSIPFELHIFPQGDHGLSLATKETKSKNWGEIREDCAVWVDLFEKWVDKL